MEAMGTDERPPAGTLIDRLAGRPQGFNLFQAISLLERAVPDARPVGEGSGGDEAVRLSALVSLGFQPSDVAAVSAGAVTGEAFTLSTPVLSLAGAQGPLPLPFTEMALERRAARDRAMVDFLDIFNHRFLSFLYRGRKKHHLGLNWAQTERASLASCLDSLSALGLASGAHAPGGETSWLRHAGLMGGAPRSLSGLLAMLGDRLNVKVRGEQFRGAWQALAEGEVTRLGARGPGAPRLGDSAVLGRRAWYQGAGLRIEFIGLPLARLNQFLPGGPEHALTQWLVKRYVQQDLRVELILKPAVRDVGRAALGRGGGLKLGWTAWLKTGAGTDANVSPTRLDLGAAGPAGQH
jgi:type VI secretion system protein ImpH